MNFARWIHGLGLVLSLLMSVVVFTVSAEGQTIYALLVIMDADARIGPATVVDMEKVNNLLRDIVVKRVCSVQKRVLRSREDTATTDEIKQWLRNVRPSDQDVIFVYFSGHGGMLNNETFIALQGSFLYRKDLVSHIKQASNCRLKILITDSCSNDVRQEDPPDLNPTLESALKKPVCGPRRFPASGCCD